MAIMIYNNPLRTGFDLQPETLVKLAGQFPNIVAFKEAGDTNSVPIIKKQLGPSFTVLSGSDLNIFKEAEIGFDGITSILGNIFPKEIQRLLQPFN
ncbi:dihydrodipicolinate synthase family protein [Priestia megaterium]|nr:dihydrodipicolinate synthase family protein [Priestia megaterium]MED4068925.1 dihydrodipicolinate synthase family protein [Priestia megaterium]